MLVHIKNSFLDNFSLCTHLIHCSFFLQECYYGGFQIKVAYLPIGSGNLILMAKIFKFAGGDCA